MKWGLPLMKDVDFRNQFRQGPRSKKRQKVVHGIEQYLDLNVGHQRRCQCRRIPGPDARLSHMRSCSCRTLGLLSSSHEADDVLPS